MNSGSAICAVSDSNRASIPSSFSRYCILLLGDDQLAALCPLEGHSSVERPDRDLSLIVRRLLRRDALQPQARCRDLGECAALTLRREPDELIAEASDHRD